MRKAEFGLLIGLVLFPAGIFSQNLLRNPEHIAYDPIHQRYLVANYGNGTIVSIDQAGTLKESSGNQVMVIMVQSQHACSYRKVFFSQ